MFDDVFNGWSTTALVGLGVVVAAPLLLPTVGAIVYPMAKGLIKGGLFVVESVQKIVAEGGEQLNALVTEAKAEYHAGTTTS
jgi:Protein of unknown function (DUF5132)